MTGASAVDAVRARGDITFESAEGRLLSVTSNGERAMVMLLREAGDPGEHAIDPSAAGRSDGYVLSNGQNDTYDDRDTIPLDRALAVVEGVIDRDERPTDVEWQNDAAS